LAEESNLICIAIILSQIVACLNEHSARTNGWIVDAHPFLRIADFNAYTYNFSRRVEFACLLTGGIRKVFEQPFVGSAKQIGKFEVFILKRNFFKVLNEVGESVVIQGALAEPV